MEADGTTDPQTIAQISFNSTELESECPLTRTIEIFDETTNTWIIYDGSNSDHTTDYPWLGNVVSDSGFDV